MTTWEQHAERAPSDRRSLLALAVLAALTSTVTGLLLATINPLFGFAGLVAAGNSTLMVLSRRTEFAILKAVGLRGFEIALVVMVEVVALAVVGLLIGFGLAEIGNLPIILTNKIGTRAVVAALLGDFSIVAAATLGCAVVFALIPVSKTLRITVAEAMRGNG